MWRRPTSRSSIRRMRSRRPSSRELSRIARSIRSRTIIRISSRNPRYPYIAINDLPKIEDLKRVFPDLYRVAPVLVVGVHSSK
jgi:hypothetical protein